MLNWQTIITTVLLSGSFVSLIIFLLKKTLEKGIETKFKEVEHKQRLNLEEIKRRQSKIFDDQYTIYTSVMALVYRVRNGSRDIVEELNKTNYNLLFIEDKLKVQYDYFKSLKDLMLDNRIIFPELVFTELHGLSHTIDHLNSSLRILIRKSGSMMNEEVQITISKVESLYMKIDEYYFVMVGIIQSSLGVGSK